MAVASRGGCGGLIISSPSGRGLNCKRHAVHAFRSVHDVIQNQVTRELRRLNLRICIDNFATMILIVPLPFPTHHQKARRHNCHWLPPLPTAYDPFSHCNRSDIITDANLVSTIVEWFRQILCITTVERTSMSSPSIPYLFPQKAHFHQTPLSFPHINFQNFGYLIKRAVPS